MKHHLAVPLAFLIALAATAQDPDSESRSKKSGKKHVKATLTEPATPAAPSPAADAAPTSTEKPATTETDVDADTAPTSTEGAAEPAPVVAAPADTTPRDTPVLEERIDVIEVLLDAVVKDGDKPVTGLGPEDFIVEEEGHPVQVTSATFYGSPDQLSASGEGEVQRSDRYFIFLFHDRSRDATFIRPLLLDAGQQARRWVEEELLPNDQVAVASYDVRLKIQSDFTRDREQVLEAISRAVAGKKEPDRGSGRSKEPLRRDADSPSLLLNLPAGPDLARESRVFEKAVALLGRGAEGIVGRKNLMLFSVGFGETDPNGFWVPDTRYYPALEQNLNNGNVAVYSIDLLGSRRGSPASPGIASSLSSISSDTAGLVFDNFTTFITPMKQVAEDATGYYLLSYKSEYPRGTSGYRDVTVKARDQKLEVRARKGYLFGEANQPLRIPNAPDEDDDPAPREPAPREPSTG